MVITDRYDHVIDEKGRLSIPSQMRNAMDPQVDGTSFYLVPEGRYLQLIPEKLFERVSQKPAGLMPSPEDAKVRRYIFSMTSRLEVDKQGRVMIPDRYMRDSKNQDPLAQALLGREVTLVGANDRIELWNREEYVNHMREVIADRGMQAHVQRMYGSAPFPSPMMGGGEGEAGQN